MAIETTVPGLPVARGSRWPGGTLQVKWGVVCSLLRQVPPAAQLPAHRPSESLALIVFSFRSQIFEVWSEHTAIRSQFESANKHSVSIHIFPERLSRLK